MPDISVVIPTRNRPGLLGRCLGSLCLQTLDPARFEICVVNNGAADMVAKVMTLVGTHYPNHRIFVVEEQVTGVSQARNTGIVQTTSPLIAMIDDDMTAPPDWLEKFMTGFAMQDVRLGKIGGEIEPVWGAARPGWISDAMLPSLGACSGQSGSARFVEQDLQVGNSCYRREALDAAGNFPVQLGRKGSNPLTDENKVDLVMQALGWKLYYDPAIKVVHALSPDRLTPVWWRRLAFWQGVSDYAAMLYLQQRKIDHAVPATTELPLDRAYWNFINDADEVPDEASLIRMRGLGYTLAKSGFIPV